MPLVPLGDGDGRSRWTIEHGDRSFVVFVVGQEHFVTDAACPHNGGPLVDGQIRHGRTVVCPWHWYRFDLRTGRCETTQRHELRCYPVRERDGRLYADVPEPAAPRTWSQILRAHAAGTD